MQCWFAFCPGDFGAAWRSRKGGRLEDLLVGPANWKWKQIPACMRYDIPAVVHSRTPCTGFGMEGATCRLTSLVRSESHQAQQDPDHCSYTGSCTKFHPDLCSGNDGQTYRNNHACPLKYTKLHIRCIMMLRWDVLGREAPRPLLNTKHTLGAARRLYKETQMSSRVKEQVATILLHTV